MSSTEKPTPDVTTLENHAPVPPVLKDTAPDDTKAPAPAAEEEITTLENHAPVPPALRRDGK
ncbi:sigma-like protein [Streptomyces antibioticus]|uniref:sigma-like protein n=1 Tax=Streptomyces antibioticus TaxID=1890 RepID=UPI00224C96CA|nr:sigma-like protein [Streptomyces antibioticus]MCX4738490.1 sigma-like protein [Streptomyces antibioticus]